MPTSIHQRVRDAQAGSHPHAICRLKSGWVFARDIQPVAGYCLLLSDPVVSSLNDLSESDRAQYCLDMTRVGDALLKVMGAHRINYETWCNVDPALHTHIVPRYQSEPETLRKQPVCMAYDLGKARPFDPIQCPQDAEFIRKMREALAPFLKDIE
jgi:diadenosine tetraphosphate (Ap4A) HIT family hydrolase